MGLVQRVLEASGISTVALSMIPDLTRAVGVPRLAGISYPFGRPLGSPHDADSQRAVLRATLEVLASASRPDTDVELLKMKPWLLANLYSGRIPLVEGRTA